MSDPVLVLNANFEPINVCDTHRAIGLILADKASLVLNGRGEIKTISRSYPLPSVIRLDKMISRPRVRVKLSRREVFRRDNFTCQYCGRRMENLTIDHLVPRHLSGQHTWTNVVTACAQCNHRKGGRMLEEAHMHLLRIPREPPASVAYIFGRHLHEYI
ncbi:MAG: HNH endonuclease, partial [Anaerolineaceae bacterium]|nr:HNH endonuclease [Anaerolineaceae bacterium]